MSEHRYVNFASSEVGILKLMLVAQTGGRAGICPFLGNRSHNGRPTGAHSRYQARITDWRSLIRPFSPYSEYSSQNPNTRSHPTSSTSTSSKSIELMPFRLGTKSEMRKTKRRQKHERPHKRGLGGKSGQLSMNLWNSVIPQLQLSSRRIIQSAIHRKYCCSCQILHTSAAQSFCSFQSGERQGLLLWFYSHLLWDFGFSHNYRFKVNTCKIESSEQCE